MGGGREIIISHLLRIHWSNIHGIYSPFTTFERPCRMFNSPECSHIRDMTLTVNNSFKTSINSWFLWSCKPVTTVVLWAPKPNWPVNKKLGWCEPMDFFLDTYTTLLIYYIQANTMQIYRKLSKAHEFWFR